MFVLFLFLKAKENHQPLGAGGGRFYISTMFGPNAG